VAKIALGLQDKLWMGNINAKRDWGHAKDYVEGMYLMLQQEKAQDYVLATGVTTEIRTFIKMAFEEVGIEIEFKGSGVDEKGYVKSSSSKYPIPVGKEILAIDPKYFRPTEVELLIGDPTKAMKELGWSPKYDVKALCKEMVQSDLNIFSKDQFLKNAGFETKNEFE
jgi:GDPmannose 4,6-dehydratase